MALVKAQGRWINAYDLASQWLTFMHWPNTPGNQRALAAWFMAESSRKGNNVWVVGNNPLNISSKAGNYRIVRDSLGRAHYIAVYDNALMGSTAFKNVISSPNHNYPGIVKAFNFGGNPIAAIINSGWVVGGVGPSYYHTVNGHRTNLLQSIYNGLSGGHSTSTGDMSPVADVVPATLTMDAWFAMLKKAGIDTSNTQHLFTQDEATKIANLFAKDTDAAGLQNAILFFTGKNVYQSFPLAARLYAEGLIKPGGVAVAGAPKGIEDIVSGGISAVLGTIVPVFAMLGGGMMALFGIYLITKEATSTSGAGESLVSPVPVFLRERT